MKDLLLFPGIFPRLKEILAQETLIVQLTDGIDKKGHCLLHKTYFLSNLKKIIDFIIRNDTLRTGQIARRIDSNFCWTIFRYVDDYEFGSEIDEEDEEESYRLRALFYLNAVNLYSLLNMRKKIFFENNQILSGIVMVKCISATNKLSIVDVCLKHFFPISVYGGTQFQDLILALDSNPDLVKELRETIWTRNCVRLFFGNKFTSLSNMKKLAVSIE